MTPALIETRNRAGLTSLLVTVSNMKSENFEGTDGMEILQILLEKGAERDAATMDSNRNSKQILSGVNVDK